jgi:hypothetical protein
MTDVEDEQRHRVKPRIAIQREEPDVLSIPPPPKRSADVFDEGDSEEDQGVN